ncbi:MAG: hypothetical protein J0I20_04480 [Chloroflexi bacterium]|nr:hypothetical protein [Chloroflexota bacterium]OJW04358.1 MAG: hypothetical protein BGO39_11395 [Chloroflexi bacterium 54-19]
MRETDSRSELVKLLQLAYSAEMGAALAYRGHWHSLADPVERAEVRHIEAEEWLHRREVATLLRDLAAHPRLWYEIKFFIIGTVLSWLCHLAGWFIPMYGAGRLERRNYREYVQAAAFACECGHLDYTNCLLGMAETEWDHENYFRGKVETHPWHAIVPMWEKTPPRTTIRQSYRFVTQATSPAKLKQEPTAA